MTRASSGELLKGASIRVSHMFLCICAHACVRTPWHHTISQIMLTYFVTISYAQHACARLAVCLVPVSYLHFTFTQQNIHTSLFSLSFVTDFARTLSFGRSSSFQLILYFPELRMLLVVSNCHMDLPSYCHFSKRDRYS